MNESIPISDTDPKVDMVSQFHVLEYVRRMHKNTNHGVTSTEIAKYFRTRSVGQCVWRLRQAGYLKIDETGMGKGGKTYMKLVLGAKADYLLQQYNLQNDSNGFLSKRNLKIERFRKRDSIVTQQNRKQIGPFKYELPFPID